MTVGFPEHWPQRGTKQARAGRCGLCVPRSGVCPADGEPHGELPAPPVLKRVFTLAALGPWHLLVRRPGGYQGRKYDHSRHG